MKPPKETRRVEGRGRPEEGLSKQAQDRTQSRKKLSPSLARVHEAASRDKHTRFTALLHHVNVETLRRAFGRLKRGAAAGVDGETVATYEQGLTEKLQNLCDRVHRGRYQPEPVRRVYIPKPDGDQRPLGIPALEDKIVQGAVAAVLSVIYEVDFVGFSYGFRQGRSPHHALRALHTALMTQYVNWVLDADIRRFFDSVDHEWLLRMVAHRVADPRILDLIRGWLRAGVLEGKEWSETVEGTPQGAGISPLLANVFLHYALDLWVHQWRRRYARGRVVIVRDADDFVMGFQYEADARKMVIDLRERLATFGLMLHDEKTRLIEFGRRSTELREARGDRRPETFAFLGFTHCCARSRDGRFVVKRRTDRKRLTRKLHTVRIAQRRRMHVPLPDQHRWLCSILRGHYRYYGLPSNFQALDSFYREVCRGWFRALRRRSQRQLTWDRFNEWLVTFPLPRARISHSREPLAG
jgi:group II intron reverse transcriptase/maturase